MTMVVFKIVAVTGSKPRMKLLGVYPTFIYGNAFACISLPMGCSRDAKIIISVHVIAIRRTEMYHYKKKPLLQELVKYLLLILYVKELI